LVEAANDALSTPMHELVARLDLTEQQADALWLLACIELDPLAACCAQHLFILNANALSVQMLQRLVPLSAKSLAGLAQLALIDMPADGRQPLFRRPVRVSDRVLALARGEMDLDQEVRSLAVLQPATSVWRDLVPDLLPTELKHIVLSETRALIVAHGNERSGRSTQLGQAIAMTGRPVLRVNGASLSDEHEALAVQLRSLVRECYLHGAWPIICGINALGDRASIAKRELFEAFTGPVFATSDEPSTWSLNRPIVNVGTRIADAERRMAIWNFALAGASEHVIRSSAERYAISVGMIRATAASVTAAKSVRSDITTDDVHVALRGQLERKLTGIATRIETTQTWNDLVLPIDQFDVLIEMIARIKHRNHVLDTWGFADKVGRGHGVAALFSGPPGTGKTMIAGLLARELGLDLYQVDLSKVVSKYIGETEKHLATLFEAAESGHAIVLFDEADSLFAKRTEVKSSNDRYANLEVNYLLQRIEAFSGITIMTTNHETAIDQAFLRRLAFHIRVPLPDEKHRELIWRSMLPAKADRAGDLEFNELARTFGMTGGYIKNAMLRAAFLSAEEGTSITNEHVWRAARAEYEAMGKLSFQSGRDAVRSRPERIVDR
jgi:ATP-dependent 26S proteasome regulatory subunit